MPSEARQLLPLPVHYRCRFDANRGTVAADVAGHPRALLDFLARRLFGPQRLRLPRHELSRTVAEEWRQHDAELARPHHEQADFE